jgi:hypothetical protein
MTKRIVDKQCYTELIHAATVSIQDMVMANNVKTEDVIYNAIMAAYEQGMIDEQSRLFFENNHTEAIKNPSVNRFYVAFMRQVQWSKETFLSVLN